MKTLDRSGCDAVIDDVSRPYAYILCRLLLDDGLTGYLLERAHFDRDKFAMLLTEALGRGAREMVREILATEVAS